MSKFFFWCCTNSIKDDLQLEKWAALHKLRQTGQKVNEDMKTYLCANVWLLDWVWLNVYHSIKQSYIWGRDKSCCLYLLWKPIYEFTHWLSPSLTSQTFCFIVSRECQRRTKHMCWPGNPLTKGLYTTDGKAIPLFLSLVRLDEYMGRSNVMPVQTPGGCSTRLRFV